MQYLDKTGLARLWNNIKAKLSNKEDLSNKVTSIDSTSTNNQYPSAKAVYNSTTDIYSTSEIKTNNVWIDGKPIYRKVVFKNGVQSGNVAIPHNISNIKMCVKASLYANSGSLTYKDGNSLFQLVLNTVDTQNINIVTTGAYSSWGLYFILEYTKTTD